MTGLCGDRNPRNRGMSCSLPPDHASPHAMGDDGGTWPIAEQPQTAGHGTWSATVGDDGGCTEGGTHPSARHTNDPTVTGEFAYSGPCVHCGHLPDEHGENHACLRHGCYGNRYTPGLSLSPAWRLVKRSGLSRDGDDFAVGTAHPDSGNRAEVRVDDYVKVVVLHVWRVRPFPPETRPAS